MGIKKQLNEIICLLRRIALKEMIIMATIDDIATSVEAQTTVVTSVETLLVHLSQQLADASASADPAKVQAVKDAIDANTARLAAAVTANTGAPA